MNTQIIPKQFTGNIHCFQGIVTPTKIDEENNILFVDLEKDGSTWSEEWNLEHTIWGLESGEYIEIKEAGFNTDNTETPYDPYLEALGMGKDLVLPFVNRDVYMGNMYDDVTKKQMNQTVVPVTPKNPIGRNDKCPCGSGKKYKQCCLNN
jgi:hypothetical protein